MQGTIKSSRFTYKNSTYYKWQVYYRVLKTKRDVYTLLLSANFKTRNEGDMNNLKTLLNLDKHKCASFVLIISADMS